MGQKAIVAKQAKIQSVVTDLKNSKSFIIFEYHGLTAKNITALRSELHEAGSKLYVLKNNILRRSLSEAGLGEIESQIKGPNAIAIGFEDEIIPIKAVHKVATDYEVVKLKSAYIENKFVDEMMVQQIAQIPGRDGLYSMFLSCLTSPIRSFLYALKAVSEKK